MMNLQRISLSVITDNEYEDNSNVFVPERVNAKYNTENQELEITSNSDNNPDSSIYPGGRLKDKIPFNLKKGSRYTFIIEINIIEVLHGKLDKEMLKMSIIPIVGGQPQWNYAKSNQAINSEGKQYLVSEIEIPETATGVWIRLNSGMTRNGGKVTWSNLVFLNGFVPVAKFLISNNYTNLLEINETALSVNQDRAFEYAISLLNQSEIKDLFMIDEDLLLDLNDVQQIKDFLLKWSDGETTLKEIPKSFKVLLEKLGIDYKWFLHIHRRNVVERTKTLFWVVNNLSEIKKISFNDNLKKKEKNKEASFPIFVYWADGFENAPEIIKSIHSILKSKINNAHLVLLNNENIKFYIDLPDNIDALFNTNIAHATDYYRLALLKKYGGVWIDSTVVPGNNFENKLIEILKRNNNVVTPRYENNLATSSSISNWFIAVSEPQNELISMVEVAVRLWIKDNIKFSYYFMFHSIWDFLIQLDEDLKTIWENSDYLSAYDSHEIQRKMYERVTDESLKVLENNLVNKLTYKYDSKLNSSNSLLSFIGRKMQ